MGYLFQLQVLMLQTLTFKYKKMKNSFKLGFVALVIAVSAAACGGKSTSGSSDTTVKVDSTVKKDSVVKVDSTAVKADSTKKDTTKK
jgi:ABC-type glycerol-3-phosphate transport system substrate-binding protein